jgi:hypothetical protein
VWWYQLPMSFGKWSATAQSFVLVLERGRGPGALPRLSFSEPFSRHFYGVRHRRPRFLAAVTRPVYVGVKLNVPDGHLRSYRYNYPTLHHAPLGLNRINFHSWEFPWDLKDSSWRGSARKMPLYCETSRHVQAEYLEMWKLSHLQWRFYHQMKNY